MAEAELLALKKALDGADAPADALSGALAKLEAMPMTVALIESTQIGVSVGKLRRHADAAIAETSKRIVSSWRGLLKPAAAPAASPASSQSPAPVRESSGALKRSSSEANEEGKGKVEAKAEAPKKSKSSSEVKEEGGDGKRAKGDEGGGELKKSKSDNEAAKKAKPSPAPARASPRCHRALFLLALDVGVSLSVCRLVTHAVGTVRTDGVAGSGEGDRRGGAWQVPRHAGGGARHAAPAQRRGRQAAQGGRRRHRGGALPRLRRTLKGGKSTTHPFLTLVHTPHAPSHGH